MSECIPKDKCPPINEILASQPGIVVKSDSCCSVVECQEEKCPKRRCPLYYEVKVTKKEKGKCCPTQECGM